MTYDGISILYTRDSARGRGRTRPEYLVNKRRPIETKMPGVRIVTSAIIQHRHVYSRPAAFLLERIRFSFDRPVAA